jgi:hypothetical protein
VVRLSFCPNDPGLSYFRKRCAPVLQGLALMASLAGATGCFNAQLAWQDLDADVSSDATASTPSDTGADLTPPVGTVVINGGNSATHFHQVSLTLTASDAQSAPVTQCIQNGNTCSGCGSYTAFTSSASATLTDDGSSMSVAVSFKDGAGNTTCVTQSIGYVGSVTVGPRFANAPNWNDYVRRCAGGANLCPPGLPGPSAVAVTGVTGATGGATAVVHGGEHRVATTVEHDCTGLSMTDQLGAFDWKCALDAAGFATFYSTLKPSKGLADLVNDSGSQLAAGAWKSNSVTLTKGTENVVSASGAWWGNIVRQLPANASSCASDTLVPAAWSCSGTLAKLGVPLATTATAGKGIIFTAPAGFAGTAGYSIAADSVGIVTVGSSAVLKGNPANLSGNNCSDMSGNYEFTDTSPSGRCLIAGSGRDFLWIEGQFAGSGAANSPGTILGLGYLGYSRIRRASFAGSIGNGGGNLVLTYAVGNRISQVRSVDAGNYGIWIEFISTGNILSDVVSTLSGSANLFFHRDFGYNVMTDLSVASAAFEGVRFLSSEYDGSGGQRFNTLSRLTSVNNGVVGFTLVNETTSNDPAYTISNTILHNAAVVSNGNSSASSGLSVMGGGGTGAGNPGVDYVPIRSTTLDQLAVTTNTASFSSVPGTSSSGGGIYLFDSTGEKLTGNILIGQNLPNDCVVTGDLSGLNPGAVSGTCAPTGISNHVLRSGLDGASDLVALVSSDSSNASDTSGVAALSILAANPLSYFSFDNPYRFWNYYPGAVAWPDVSYADGPVTATSARIFDFSLKSSATTLLNRTGNGSTANGSVSSGNCPAEAAGSAYLTSAPYAYDPLYFGGLDGISTGTAAACASGNTDCVQRYLANAVEMMGDDVGDDDGLCESGEACLYTPNFGAYQGHGTLQQCAFDASGGPITGVTMYYYPSNGY